MSATDVELPPNVDLDEVPMDRADMLTGLGEILEEIEYKTAGDGRIRDPDRFELLLKAFHEYGYLVRTANDVLGDREDAAEVEQRLEDLERRLGT